MNNNFSKLENLQWCRMGPRATFGQFMIEIVKRNKKLMVISADLGRSSGLDRFKAKYPNKYISNVHTNEWKRNRQWTKNTNHSISEL